MSLKIIGAGYGRTGSLSLHMALEQLGLGPCYHMKEVLGEMPLRVPHWNAVLDGSPDWQTIYQGYHSAVDWPTASFWHELSKEYPDAKVILSTRSAESWYQSFSQTILAVLSAPYKWPEPQVDWLTMCRRLIVDHTFKGEIGPDALIAAFDAHEERVKATIPSERLLVHSAKEGWEPLGEFLNVSVPDTPYPRSNSREEFFELIANG